MKGNDFCILIHCTNYHRVLTVSRCEWIPYESGHKFFMKASQILCQTVTDSLSVGDPHCRELKMVIIEIFRVMFC